MALFWVTTTCEVVKLKDAADVIYGINKMNRY